MHSIDAPLGQLVESTGSNSVQSRFEPEGEHQIMDVTKITFDKWKLMDERKFFKRYKRSKNPKLRMKQYDEDVQDYVA